MSWNTPPFAQPKVDQALYQKHPCCNTGFRHRLSPPNLPPHGHSELWPASHCTLKYWRDLAKEWNILHYVPMQSGTARPQLSPHKLGNLAAVMAETASAHYTRQHEPLKQLCAQDVAHKIRIIFGVANLEPAILFLSRIYGKDLKSTIQRPYSSHVSHCAAWLMESFPQPSVDSQLQRGFCNMCYKNLCPVHLLDFGKPYPVRLAAYQKNCLNSTSHHRKWL